MLHSGDTRLIRVSKKDENDLWGFCDHFIRFTLNKEIASAKFHFYFFQLTEIRKYVHHNMVSSEGQNTVSQGTVKSISVPSIDLEIHNFYGIFVQGYSLDENIIEIIQILTEEGIKSKEKARD